MTVNRLHQRLALGAGLAVLWLVLSGHFTALLLAFGAVSVVVTGRICMRMDLHDHEIYPYQPNLLAVLRYLPWLAREVVLSALDVSKRVLSRDMALSPQVLWVPASQSSAFGRTIFANSITLTPGTVSIDVTDTHIEVHALTGEGADDLATGEMDRHVTAIERPDEDAVH